jgi:hypothetical protein
VGDAVRVAHTPASLMAQSGVSVTAAAVALGHDPHTCVGLPGFEPGTS